MKNLLLSVIAILFVIAASAQNKAIDALAEKYADTEGFEVTNLDRNAIRKLGNPRNIDVEDVSELLKNISSVTAIFAEKPAGDFEEEVKSAVAGVNYSQIMSYESDGQFVNIIDTKPGKRKKEIIVTISSDRRFSLIRATGKIDTTLLKILIENKTIYLKNV